MTKKSPEILLKLQNISVHFGEVLALDDVSLSIDEGEIVALMGPNGAGKSTILKTIIGLTPYTKGKILLHNLEIKPAPHTIINEGISFVPQGRRVFAHLSVKENLEIGAIIIKDKNVLKQRMEELLVTFPVLKQKLKSKAGTLSGGQQQMLALARGLMVDPKIILLDEPTLGLAPNIVKELFVKLKQINQNHKTAIIIVEHNIKSLLEIAHRAYILDKGQVVTHAPAKKLIGSDILEQVFTGGLSKKAALF